MKGDGAGNFAPVDAIYPVAGTCAWELDAADIDGDLDLDIVTANGSTPSVSVIRNNGSGVFGAATDYSVGVGFGVRPQRIKFHDVDGVTGPDIVVVENGTGEVSVLLNDGTGSFAAPVAYATIAGIDTLDIGDVDGDTFPDIITARSNTTATVYVLFNDGSGGFGSSSTFASGGTCGRVQLGNLDSDSDLDLAVQTYCVAGQGTRVFLNDGSATFTMDALYPFDSETNDDRDVTIADLDGDGNQDITVAERNFGGDYTSSAKVLRGDGTGTFTLNGNYPWGVKPNDIEHVDLNNDGELDLVMTSSSWPPIAVHVNKASAAVGVTVTESGGSTSVSEGGGPDTYTVVLDAQPTHNVTVSVSPDSQLSTDTSSLVFTPGNWNIPQTVSVTAVNDGIPEGAHTGTVTHAATSNDGNYNGIPVDDVVASISEGTQLVSVPGEDPTQLSIDISKLNFPVAGSASAAIVARRDKIVDALVSVPLSSRENATLLLSDSEGLLDNVAEELQRALGPDPNKTIYLAGGTEALAGTYETDIQALGYKTPTRFAGVNRNQTAQFIATQIYDLNPRPSSRVILGENRAFADVLGLGGIPTVIEPDDMVVPIILTERASADLDQYAREYLEATQPTEVIIIGGPAAVDPGVEPAIKIASSGVTQTRVQGANRYATNQLLNQAYYPDPFAVVVVNGNYQSLPGAVQTTSVATGGFQALLAGTVAARQQGAVVLSDNTQFSVEAVEYLQNNTGSTVVYYVIGYSTDGTSQIQNQLSPIQ